MDEDGRGMNSGSVPAEATAAVREVCGDGADLRLVSDRRGTAVWKAAGPLRSVAVKVGVGREGAAITARESAVLDAMGRGALLAYAHGQEAAWLMTPWYDGLSTWSAMVDVRAGAGVDDAARRLVVDVCEAVAELHASGWVHGDLQPHHTLHTHDQGVVFIDCSWAWRPGVLPASSLFRGGLPHLLAPELAAEVEAGVRPLVTTQAAEVYALGASLWWAIAGEWPLDYDAAGVATAGLPSGQLRDAISSGRIPLHPPKAWPDGQDVLATALRPDPDQRPDAAELAAAVAKAR
jgi:serine/threonine protein kinase